MSKLSFCLRSSRRCFPYKTTDFYKYLHSGLNVWNEDLTSELKKKIESYWHDKLWSPNYNANDELRQKFYVLSMFPYPSGQLHMGHVRVYTISDAVARYHRMHGKNVFHPIGWDAFGLPAENAAIERNISPDEWTKKNIAQMKRQLQKLACSFDWSHELSTCDPNYYRWTQYIFLKLYQEGLVYQKEATVNWDPVDKTVLADEQVDENGCSWRSGAKIEKKVLKQWFIRTTKFAKDLLDGLKDPVLQDWRDIIKLQQHWIGDCNGASFDFKMKNAADEAVDVVTVWTPKPEHMINAKFIAVKPTSVVGKRCQTGAYKAENPLTGETIPIFVTDDVSYAPSCEHHLGLTDDSDADLEFARAQGLNPVKYPDVYTAEETAEIRAKICESAESLGAGGHCTSSKLRDWLISRQRYWGTPIPVVYCTKCGVQPVPEASLPVLLPKLEASTKGAPVLAECADWLNTTCPRCGGDAKRETDTMDTFVDSSWYFFRYIDPHNDQQVFDEEKVANLSPVDLYIGGKEHAVLHLYYARFMSHFLHSIGMVPEREPFHRLLVQGMVMGQAFRAKGSGRYLQRSEVDIVDAKRHKAVEKATGAPVVISWEKMSKSKLNGVDPEEMFDKYSTDTIRLLMLADVAPTSHRNWNENTFPGIINWQRRLWMTLQKFLEFRLGAPRDCPDVVFEEDEFQLFDSRNYFIKETTFNYYTSQQMSVAISKMQGLTNSLRRVSPAVVAKGLQFERALASQIIMLAPMAPHFASELWAGFLSAPNRLNTNENEVAWNRSVLEQKWPEVDYDYNLNLVFQINGSESALVKMSRQELESLNYTDAIEIALNDETIQSSLKSRRVIDIKFDVFPGYEGIVNIIAGKNVK